jgi:hypothetical protein
MERVQLLRGARAILLVLGRREGVLERIVREHEVLEAAGQQPGLLHPGRLRPLLSRPEDVLRPATFAERFGEDLGHTVTLCAWRFPTPLDGSH